MFWISRAELGAIGQDDERRNVEANFAPQSPRSRPIGRSAQVRPRRAMMSRCAAFPAGDAREGEKIVDELARAGCRGRNDRSGAGDAARVRFGDRFLHQACVDGDLAQRLLEIVRGDIGELGRGARSRARVRSPAEPARSPTRRRAVISTIVASTMRPESASIGVRAISTGNSTPSLRVPLRSRPAPIGRLLGSAKKPRRKRRVSRRARAQARVNRSTARSARRPRIRTCARFRR